MRIKEVLSENGVSQVELARRLNVGVVSVKKTIAGNPTVNTLQRMAEVLNVPVWQFFVSPEEASGKAQDDDFVAMVRFRGDYYHADSISELEKLIADWKEQITEK